MASKDFWTFEEDFLGNQVFSATAADNSSLRIKDTSSGGTPTYALVDGSASGEINLAFDSTNEAQIVTLYQGDILQFDIDDIIEATFRVKLGQSTVDAATTFCIGLAGDQNDTADTVAQNCWLRLAGSTAWVAETDDGTTDNDDVATGKTASTSYQWLTISFAEGGKSDVRFFIDGSPVATGTTFDMSGYSGSLQLFVQHQKSADTNTDSVLIDYARVTGRRS